MIVVESPSALLEARASITGSVGVVPTMGALHAGHASLLERSRRENQQTILTLFVNPTQFDRAEDLARYPRTFEQDLALARSCGANLVFAPRDPALLYPDDYRYRVTENDRSRALCGASRPGHFDGVLTVVMKLLQLARADRAYFGEKDFQQLELVSGMARAFFLPTEIVPCPIVRESDGLAMSSRNRRLSPQGRAMAGNFAAAFADLSKPLAAVRANLEALGIQIDYLEESHGRRFAAVWIEGVRLIDNHSRGSGS